MKKLSSFTIIELIVAMLIGSIIISICYYAFFLMNSRFSKFYTKSQRISEYQLFYRSIQVDFDEAISIKNGGGNDLSFQFEGKNSADYIFYDSCIVRLESHATDTFRLQSFMHSAIPINDSIPLISKVKINVMLDKEILPVTLSKEYTSRELINYYTTLHE